MSDNIFLTANLIMVIVCIFYALISVPFDWHMFIMAIILLNQMNEQIDNKTFRESK